MSGDAVTIIVPCYNVEKYLDKCMESILKQTYKNIEIVLVDDYSTDKTRDIIHKYSSEQENVRAIYNEKNYRQGYARNVAMQTVDTKYVAFVDSDDWLEPDFIEQLYLSLTASGADLSTCDIFMRHDNPSADYRVTMYNPKPTKYGLMNVGLAASSSNKLFKTSVLKKYKYPEDIINEDVSVILAIMYKHKVVYTNKTYYNYYQRPGSTQNGKITNKRFDIFRAVEVLKTNIHTRIDKKTWDAIVWHQIIQLLLGVLPRASGVFYRRGLIQEFLDKAENYDIDIFDNLILKQTAGSTKKGFIYIRGLMLFMRHRLLLLASVWMGVYIFYMRHKHRTRLIKKLAKVPVLLFRDPKVFFSKLRARVFRRYVIKNNVSMYDLLNAANRQAVMSGHALVSVVIPNYNYERFLLQRIYSILSQKRKIGEIIILDDNSSDNSVALAKKIERNIGHLVPVRLINNKKNRGTFRQWERGFSVAKHDYVWIAEADDYCDTAFLDQVLSPMEQDPTIVLSYSDTGFVHEDGLFLESVKRHIDYQDSGHWRGDYINDGLDEVRNYSYLNNTVANVSSVVFKKKPEIDYAELFSLSREFKQAGDWVFYVNYMLHGKVAYIDKPLNFYRLHGNNVSSQTKAKDHLTEIHQVYDMLGKKINLTNAHKKAQQERTVFLKKAWNIEGEG